MLARVQAGLEALYRVETGIAIDDFVVDGTLRDALGTARKPREQLLVCEAEGEMSLGLFIDPEALENLAAHDPSHRLDDRNLGDFLLAVEGVSHLIYAVWCARTGRAVSQLELELQAEVDKYITCLLAIDPAVEVSAGLRRRLFADPVYEDDLDDDEHDRYRTANDGAQRYATWLEGTFLAQRRIPDMLGELRWFYRQGLAAKLSTIARAA
jgi:hypothetical protein